MKVKDFFSDADLQSITNAVKNAEAKTSGEIVVQISLKSHKWFFRRALTSVLAFVVGFVIALWVSSGKQWTSTYDYSFAFLAGSVGFLFEYFIYWKFVFTTSRKKKYVWIKANSIFNTMGKTNASTGVLIFISLQEQMAAIIADKAINWKVRNNYWATPHTMITDAMIAGNPTNGILRAITDIGNRLEEKFPKADNDVNELDDKPRIDET